MENLNQIAAFGNFLSLAAKILFLFTALIFDSFLSRRSCPSDYSWVRRLANIKASATPFIQTNPFTWPPLPLPSNWVCKCTLTSQRPTRGLKTRCENQRKRACSFIFQNWIFRWIRSVQKPSCRRQTNSNGSFRNINSSSRHINTSCRRNNNSVLQCGMSAMRIVGFRGFATARIFRRFLIKRTPKSRHIKVFWTVLNKCNSEHLPKIRHRTPLSILSINNWFSIYLFQVDNQWFRWIREFLNPTPLSIALRHPRYFTSFLGKWLKNKLNNTQLCPTVEIFWNKQALPVQLF